MVDACPLPFRCLALRRVVFRCCPSPPAVIEADWPLRGLRDFLLKRFGDMLRQQPRRAGAGIQIIVSGIDGESDKRHQSWRPLLHRIAPAALRQPVNDAARQVSYCVKSLKTQKVRYCDDAGTVLCQIA